jgi:hypothetical protein
VRGGGEEEPKLRAGFVERFDEKERWVSGV